MVVTDVSGVRFLSFGTEWVQGAMRLSRPDWLELAYAQAMMSWMLFVPSPKRIAHLGLGAGSLARFCRRRFPLARLDVAEINPEVLRVCEERFELPPQGEMFSVHVMDALDFVLDRSNHGLYEVLQADLYDADAGGPVLDSPEFYQGCADCLSPGGWMSVNLFGGHSSYEPNLQAIQGAFERVVCLAPMASGNVVALACKGPIEADLAAMGERAEWINVCTGMPTDSWMASLAPQLGTAPL